MNIRIGFSTSNSWISEAIEKVTKAKVSHAFFIIDDPNLGTLIYQSDEHGPEIVSLAKFLLDRKIVAAILPAIDIEQAVRDSIEKYIGFGYDVGADISDGLNDLAKRVGLHWHLDFAEKHASECSALVARTLQLAHDPVYPGADKLNKQLIEPGELLDFVVASKKPT